jgi:hypothetical protein
VISFDSFREEVYHEIRKGPLQIVEEAVNRIQSVSPETHLTANILAQKRNVDHFEATVRYTYNQLEMDSASLLVPSVEPQGFGWEYEDEDGEPPIGVLELEEIRRLEDQYYNILSDDNLRSFISQPANALADYVEYLKMLAGYDGELSKRGCFVPEETITLTPHGDFKTCFYLSDRFEWEDHEVPPSQLEERQSFLEEYEETQPETCEYCMQFACNERLRPVVQWTASNPA